MPIIKSAKKRVRVAGKAAIRNSKTKRSMREAWKAFAASPSAKSRSEAQSRIDTAAKKGVIHKNKAARLQRQAAAKAKAAGLKPVKAVKAKSQPAKAAAKAAPKPNAKKTAKKPSATSAKK